MKRMTSWDMGRGKMFRAWRGESPREGGRRWRGQRSTAVRRGMTRGLIREASDAVVGRAELSRSSPFSRKPIHKELRSCRRSF